MTDSDIYWTFVTASKYGGSFYQAMGNAGFAADPINKRRILNTWPDDGRHLWHCQPAAP
jgi:hypothetical protein